MTARALRRRIRTNLALYEAAAAACVGAGPGIFGPKVPGPEAARRELAALLAAQTSQLARIEARAAARPTFGAPLARAFLTLGWFTLAFIGLHMVRAHPHRPMLWATAATAGACLLYGALSLLAALAAMAPDKSADGGTAPGVGGYPAGDTPVSELPAPPDAMTQPAGEDPAPGPR